MRCFDNGWAKLSASDRTADLKSRTIYAATSSEIRGKGGQCGNYNGSVKVYRRTGALRSARSHELLLNLSKGHALCLDGTGTPGAAGQQQRGLERCPGAPCGLNAFPDGITACNSCSSGQVKVSMPWNMFTTLNLADPSQNCLEGLVTVWSKAPGYGTSLSIGGAVRGIWPNVITQDNLDGSGVVIDPSNILFGTNELCSHPWPLNLWRRFARVRRGVKVVGRILQAAAGGNAGGLADPITCSQWRAKIIGTGWEGRTFLLLGGLITPPTPSDELKYWLSGVDDVPTGAALLLDLPCCDQAGQLLTLYARVHQGWMVTPGEEAAGAYPPPPFAPFGFTLLVLAGSVVKHWARIMPAEVTTFHGDPCKTNLSWGNWTKQNYMASFNYPDPYLGFSKGPLPRELGR